MADDPKPVYFAADLIIARDHKILFVVRKHPPFEGMLALPGGFVEPNETAETAAIRELQEETGVTLPESALRFVKLSSEPDRDPRGRVISAAYLAEVPTHTQAMAADDAREVVWLPLEQVNRLGNRGGLAFDHRDILRSAEDMILALGETDNENP